MYHAHAYLHTNTNAQKAEEKDKISNTVWVSGKYGVVVHARGVDQRQKRKWTKVKKLGLKDVKCKASRRVSIISLHILLSIEQKLKNQA